MDLAAAQSRGDAFSFNLHAEDILLQPSAAGAAAITTRAIPDHLGRFATDTPGGRGRIDAQGCDFIFLARELDVKPQKNWKITYGGCVYSVLPNGNHAACEYEPGDFVFLRVHTKRISGD